MQARDLRVMIGSDRRRPVKVGADAPQAARLAASTDCHRPGRGSSYRKGGSGAIFSFPDGTFLQWNHWFIEKCCRRIRALNTD
jgi:hypothetical protein